MSVNIDWKLVETLNVTYKDAKAVAEFYKDNNENLKVSIRNDKGRIVYNSRVCTFNLSDLASYYINAVKKKADNLTDGTLEEILFSSIKCR